jgi:hypothetical protein
VLQHSKACEFEYFARFAMLCREQMVAEGILIGRISCVEKMFSASFTAAGGRTPGNDIITPSQCTVPQVDGCNRRTAG